jgi:hypothetical protein
MTDSNDEIANLKREVAALKNAIKPPPRDLEKEAALWRDEIHRASEARASASARSHYHPDQLRDMEAACPTPQIQAIAREGRVHGPCGQLPPDYSATAKPLPPGSGWVRPRRLPIAGS